ncbi:MAG: hypothetical protein ABI239_11380 [Aquihabitans sp.]
MRLVIDFEPSRGQWSGMVLAEPDPGTVAVPTPFSGRLELLRLLESLVEGASNSPPEQAEVQT